MATAEDTPVEIDLRTLVTDVETPLEQLQFQVSEPRNGSVELLADGYTARFNLTRRQIFMGRRALRTV